MWIHEDVAPELLPGVPLVPQCLGDVFICEPITKAEAIAPDDHTSPQGSKGEVVVEKHPRQKNTHEHLTEMGKMAKITMEFGERWRSWMPKSSRTARNKAENGGSKPTVTKPMKTTISLGNVFGGCVTSLTTDASLQPSKTSIFLSFPSPSSLMMWGWGRTAPSICFEAKEPPRVFLCGAMVAA